MPDNAWTAPTMRRPRRRAAALLMVSALLTLGACGSDDGGDDTAGATTTPATSEAAPTSETAPGTTAEPTDGEPTDDGAGPQEITIAAVDFDYELPTTEFEAGELTIELVNEGGASHNIAVERDGEDVAQTDVIAPGETATLEVTLEPGEYVFYCQVGNHRAMGMEVAVTVT